VTRRILVVALAATLAMGAAACGDDDGAEGEPTPPTEPVETTSTEPGATTSTAGEEELPPPNALDLEPLYGEALAAIGMKLTDRGGTIDRSDGGYVASPTGRHLALYVEPIEPEHTMQAYYDGILDVALVFSDIYDRWPLLETDDVCQEPPDPDGAQGDEPLPVTQIELTRAESDAIDWDSVTVEDLVRAAEADQLTLRVSREMAAFPKYAALLEDGGGWDAPAYSSGY